MCGKMWDALLLLRCWPQRMNKMKYQLTGEYDLKIDAKGRIKMPTNLLKQLTVSTGTDGNYSFVVNRGYENHLILYPQDVWEKKTKELNRLNINIKKNRQALRYMYRGATQINADNSDRVLLPKNLISYAGIKKEVVLFAYLDQIEIWAKDAYQDMIDQEPEDFSALAEEVFGGQASMQDQEDE